MVLGALSYASKLARRIRRFGSSLEDDLKRITDSGIIDIPQELFTVVIEESREEQSRKIIMNHLRQCLTDVSAKDKGWKRAYAAMELAEELLDKGSSALLAETAVGRHFDLVQRLSFLEDFVSSHDLAQSLVRSKAKSLRTIVIFRLRAFGGKFQRVGNQDGVDDGTESTCSPKGSVATSHFTGSEATPSWEAPTYDFEDLVQWAESPDSEPEDEIL